MPAAQPSSPQDHGRAGRRHEPHHTSIRQTVIALLAAFCVVLVFRAFVVEAFIIPTGSMAPTLLGRHARLHNPHTGMGWAVGMSDAPAGASSVHDLIAEDPATGLRVRAPDAPLRSGDRVFVLKFMYALHEPKRWDVVVFHLPENPEENYIKRLVGLPGERVWIVDGDIFIAPSGSESNDAWRIARKPRAVQDALWRPLFSSEMAPIDVGGDRPQWPTPWREAGERDGDPPRAWDLRGAEYTTEAERPPPLVWDGRILPIDDWNAYNDSPTMRSGVRTYPVADLRVRSGVRPQREGLSWSATIDARGHRFRAVVDAGETRLEMTPIASLEDGAPPAVVARTESAPLPAQRVTDLAFVHADQALELWRDGTRVVRFEYDWSPIERLAHATGHSPEDLAPLLEDRLATELALPALYEAAQARVSIGITGAPATLTRVGLDRDLHYQPALRVGGSFTGEPGLGSHPMTAPSLREREFYVLGDNSASSRDSRSWDRVDPWVERAIGPPMGVVPRDLLIGEAFFVYFPAPHEVRVGGDRWPLVPDFGRMRFIR